MDIDLLFNLYLALWLAILGAVLGSFLCCAADRGACPPGAPGATAAAMCWGRGS